MLVAPSYFQTSHEQREQLVQRYAPLVKKIALHLKGRLPPQVQLDDLLQAGMLGLLEAARQYDAGKGASFETYAGIRIQGAMIDEIRRGDWVPRSVHRNARRISEAIEAVEQRTGAEARAPEIAQELGVSLEEYWAMLADVNGGRLLDLDDDDGNRNYEETLVDPQGQRPGEAVEQQHFRQSLAKSIKQLPEREQLVLALYYDEEMNLKEIGAVLGVSESRVSQILSQTVLRLRSRLKGWHDLT